MDFKDKINNLLSSKNLTAYRLSKETGIHQTTVGKWRAGTQKPTAENCKTLADYFGMPIEFFIESGDTQDESKSNHEKLFKDITKLLDNPENEQDLIKVVELLKLREQKRSEQGAEGKQIESANEREEAEEPEPVEKRRRGRPPKA